MQTYSHVIIAAIMARGINGQDFGAEGDSSAARVAPPFGGKAFLFGSVAPDLPLILLTAVFLAKDVLFGSLGVDGSSVERLFRYQFYHDPWVITAHNLFHAPLLVLLYVSVGFAAWRRGLRWGPALFWFAAGCMLHTLVDIPLHYDDGPLVFYPLDWETRFYSPVSYWDPQRYGIPASIAEHVMVAGMLVYLVIGWRRRRRTRI